MAIKSDIALSLSKVPHDTVVMLLQQLGLAMVHSILNNEPLNLATIITPGLSLPANPIRLEPKQSYTAFIKASIAQVPDDLTWQQTLSTESAHLLRMKAGDLFPPDLWNVLGIRAWVDGLFRYRIANEVISYLSRRIIELDKGTVCPVFSPNTFWLLLAAITARAMPQDSSSLIVHILHTLQRVGAEIGFRPAWATTWDQWLLLRANKQEEFFASHPTIARSVDALPLVRQTLQSEQAQDDSGITIPLAKKDWFQEVSSTLQMQLAKELTE